MIPLQIRLSIFFRNIWNGILGIVAELLLVAVIILSGFLVCTLWWALFR